MRYVETILLCAQKLTGRQLNLRYRT